VWTSQASHPPGVQQGQRQGHLEQSWSLMPHQWHAQLRHGCTHRANGTLHNAQQCHRGGDPSQTYPCSTTPILSHSSVDLFHHESGCGNVFSCILAEGHPRRGSAQLPVAHAERRLMASPDRRAGGHGGLSVAPLLAGKAGSLLPQPARAAEGQIVL